MLKKTTCPLDCPDGCDMLAKVEGGKILSLQGDPEHPFTKGFLCAKMRRYHERAQGPERIQTPLKRSGPKGSGQFVPITWEEAWQILVQKLTETKEKWGGEALLPYSYAGNMGQINRWAGYPFFHKYGASRLGFTICSAAAAEGWAFHTGVSKGSNPELVAQSKLIVAWGVNLKTTNIHLLPLINQARRQGAKLVVIDPYQNATAKAADHYFQVRPAGDVALALGLAKLTVEAGKEDQAFIQQATSGFADFAAYLKQAPWAEIERQSGLSQERIKELAQLLWAEPKTFIRMGLGLTRNSRGAMQIRAITCLAAVLGLFGGGEGRGVLMATRGFPGNDQKLAFPQLAPKTTRLINMIQLGEALTKAQDPPIKMMFVYSSNPMSVAPDSGSVRRGLSREDLFLVVHEQVMTPTALYADLVLPATTSLENQDVYPRYGHYYISRVAPVIEPVGQAKSNFDLFQELARRMGYDDPVFFQTIEQRIEGYLEGLDGFPPQVKPADFTPGSTLASIYKDVTHQQFGPGKHIFRFKVETNNPLVPPLACLIPAAELDHPDLTGRFPFELITPPHMDVLNSTFGERYQGQLGQVLVHPADAQRLGLQDGQKAKLHNLRGQAPRLVKISNDTKPGLLVAEGVFWEKDQPGLNQITSQVTTDLGGGAIFHETRVGLAAWEEGA